MCGPITLLIADSRASNALYQVTRLLAYALLGAACGSLGKSIFASLAYLALPMVGTALLAIISGILLLTILRGRPLEISMPNFLRNFALGNAAHAKDKHQQAIWLGLASVFLPCGWLYTFALVAVGTQSALQGAFLMSIFWLGTIPILAALPFIRELLPLRTKLSPRVRAALSLALILALGSLRMEAPQEPSQNSTHFNSCYSKDIRIFTASDRTPSMSSMIDELLPWQLSTARLKQVSREYDVFWLQ